MSFIAVTLAEGPIDFPDPGSRYCIEENIGDDYPIHIHFGKFNDWKIRLHFTYEGFITFARQTGLWRKMNG